jgi:DNA-binding transcriptional LysR family regulator
MRSLLMYIISLCYSWPVNVRQFHLFCDIAESHSFSKGAALNGVTQAAASQLVRQLEKNYATALIDRSTRPLTLTASGQVCYQAFREIIDRLTALKKVGTRRDELKGEVRVAAIYSVGLYAIGRRMQEFMNLHPQVKVRLVFLPPKKVYEAVESDDADLGLVSYPKASRALGVIPLYSEPAAVVCHPRHRLARAEQVNIEQLMGEPFIAFEQTLIIRRKIDQYLRTRKVAVRIVMEFDNIETIKQAVEIGAGVSILPEPTVRTEVERGIMALLPVALPDLRRPLGILRRRKRELDPCAEGFVQLLTAS